MPPNDPAAFDAHYFGVHVPLAKKLPGLRKYEVSRLGKACAADRRVLAPGEGDVQRYLFDTAEF